MAFASGTKTNYKMDVLFPIPGFLNNKQGRKNLRKRIHIWVEQQLYTNETVLQNYKHSGRLRALIRSTGWQPNLETESTMQPVFVVFIIHGDTGYR